MNASEHPFSPTPASIPPHPIKIGKRSVVTQQNGKQVEATVFTMSLGSETIELWPFKNWGQLDVHKWSVRGKLPATPAGLEIAPDHLKVAGETVSIKDAEGCGKLESVLNEWLLLETGTLEIARKKSQPKPAGSSAVASRPTEEQSLRYQVDMDHEGQVHIKCVQGKESLAEIGLTQLGWQSLVSQGLMHKPTTVKVGALHDWVELDGEFYSFEKGRNDSAMLEKVLNEKYLSTAALGKGKDVVVFTNAASSTGFDIQFNVTVGGVPDKRRRPLNEETLDLLQDHGRCGVLHKNLVIKLTRPSLIFKQKTADGGERYLQSTQENIVNVTDDDGKQKAIDLSQPVNYLHLSAVQLTAVFNHPAINQHGKAPTPSARETDPIQATPVGMRAPAHALEPRAEPSSSKPALRLVQPETPQPLEITAENVASRAVQKVTEKSVPEDRPRPNSWLEPILAMPSMRFDWFARLIYGQLAEKFGNCREGHFGPGGCWYASIGEASDIEDFAFHGVFLTEKGSLGFLNHEHMARFYKSVAFIGTQESALEGIDVQLTAVGMDCQRRVVFIVSADFQSKFGVPERAVLEELERLKTYGAVVLSPQQALDSAERIDVLWTVPDEQADPADPQALESCPDAAAEATPELIGA